MQKDGNHFIEIIVQPYSLPISLRGRYYYRSGSVKQKLRNDWTELSGYLENED